jgi:hypothetical protein
MADYHEMAFNYCILLVVQLGREYDYLKEYLSIRDIFSLLEVMPSGLCIFDKETNKMAYSNPQYD